MPIQRKVNSHFFSRLIEVSYVALLQVPLLLSHRIIPRTPYLHKLVLLGVFLFIFIFYYYQSARAEGQVITDEKVLLRCL